VGNQALTTEGIYQDVVREALLQRIDRGELPAWGAWPPWLWVPSTTRTPFPVSTCILTSGQGQDRGILGGQ
jgi:hypothetical protein